VRKKYFKSLFFIIKNKLIKNALKCAKSLWYWHCVFSFNCDLNKHRNTTHVHLSIHYVTILEQEPSQHGHPPPNVFAHWKNVYVAEQNNSILRGLLVMKTDGYSDYRFETYVNTDG
jgi:hypothetical protein